MHTQVVAHGACTPGGVGKCSALNLRANMHSCSYARSCFFAHACYSASLSRACRLPSANYSRLPTCSENGNLPPFCAIVGMDAPMRCRVAISDQAKHWLHIDCLANSALSKLEFANKSNFRHHLMPTCGENGSKLPFPLHVGMASLSSGFGAPISLAVLTPLRRSRLCSARLLRRSCLQRSQAPAFR